VRVRRFFRTPKGVLIIVLSILLVLAAFGAGVRLVAPGVAAAVLAGTLLDGIILRVRKHKWVFPDGALLTAMIVAMILSPHEPWYVFAVTSVLGIVSKYLIRVRTANVFNPAALALVATFYIFDTGQSWWGALPELPLPAIAVLIVLGVFIVNRVNKLPVALSFLGCYFLLVTLSTFVADPAHVAALYRAPDLHSAAYFAFFMVTDPPTSPPKHREQLIYGAIVAAAGFAVFELIGAAYFLLAGLLVANVLEGARRWGEKRKDGGTDRSWPLRGHIAERWNGGTRASGPLLSRR
jgi:Na+-translocating ferredoxin:NAD+ oxidoreductase RnfD subunit